MKDGRTGRRSLARDLWHTLHMRIALRLWPRRVWRRVQRDVDRPK